MSAKTMSSLTDENRDLRKQIGCMNGIFQLFDRHHFLTGRRISNHNHNHKRLIQGAQHQLDPQYGTKALTEKGLEMQKEKPRISTESSRASYSSSSCSSSTFSSHDFNNRIYQPETLPLRQLNIPESPFQITTTKEKPPPSLTKSKQSLELRDVVKDSMHREPRCLPIKSLANDERKGTVMKHIDSPRPSPQQPKSQKPKATGFEGSPRVLTKNFKDERLALHRFSCDGRESRETFKSSMKHKELPRLSLDSKASSMKCAAALESRLNFLPYNEEPGSHNRTSSVVAKLMGLEAFPDTISTEESRTPSTKSWPKEAFLSQVTSKAEESKQNQVTYSPRVLQNNAAATTSPRSHSANFVRKPTACSRFPMEPAPWRQQDSSQCSPKMSSQCRKAPTSTPRQSSSVYGQIEKRITELEFKKSGKDLRALKQILEAMQKTRERLDDQRGSSAEFTSQRTDQNSNLSMWKNRNSYQPVAAVKEPCTPKQLSTSAVVIMKPAKVMDEVKSSHLQKLQTQNPKYDRRNSDHRQKAKDLTPKNNNQYLPSADKKPARRTAQLDRTLSGYQLMKAENCTSSGRSSGVMSPRLQQKLQLNKHCNKKLVEKGSRNSKHKVKVKDLQLSDDQLSELSSETRYSSYYQGDTASVKSESNNSLVSQSETEVISLAHSVNTNAGQKENSVSTTREEIPLVKIAVTILEQPSPISVLDDAFYSDDSPSPVKKISTAFRGDEIPSPGEAECHPATPSHLTDCRRFNHGSEYNQKLENMKNITHEFALLNTEPDETSANQNAQAHGSLNADHKYINKILLTSGLLKDSSFISTSDQLLSSRHLINPDMFHVLEQTEEIMEGVMNGEVIEKNDRMKLNKKTQRKITFDMVNEILVRKITSGRLFTLVKKKRTSPQELLKEVYLEMDRLCRIPDCNLDDEEDEMIRLLNADMKYQSEDWVDYSGEVPAVVLDIERLIFKDLINEVVTGEVMGLHDWPKRHCRKLFSK